MEQSNGLALLVLAACGGMAVAAQETAPPAGVASASQPDPQRSAEKVRQALRETEGVPARDISVTVHGDTIVLSGKAGSEAQAAAANSAAQAAAEGARISNQIEVSPAGENVQERQQERLVREVEAALRADARTANLGVAVSIDESGVIGLHGLVPSRDSRAAAERVASQVTGSRRLKNHLAVPGER